LFGALYPWGRAPYKAVRRLVDLEDGDRLMLHDDSPAGWREEHPSAMLVHGLGGTHGSPYVEWAAHKLQAQGVRTFRLDMRGCGAGEPYARGGTHCASWGDLQAAIEHIGEVCSRSPLHTIGYSMGGSLALNLAGELGPRPCGNLASVLAVCPPVDLHAVDKAFRSGAGRFYSRHFCRMMWRQIERRLATMDNPPEVDLSRVPRDIRQLDEQVTAPFHGFPSVDAYYNHASAGPRLAQIAIPTQIIVAADDPVIPAAALKKYTLSSSIQVSLSPGGGHLGFFGRQGVDPDRRWLDWRVVEWVLAQSKNASSMRSA
jgi:predicted alpha/beta-fold hydrolase